MSYDKKRVEMESGCLIALEWDSSFFGRKIARLVIPEDHWQPEAVLELLEKARRCGVECLYVEIPFRNPGLVALGKFPGFRLVDIKTTLENTTREPAADEADPAITAVPDPRFLPGLNKIMDDLAQKSRFAFDPRFGIGESQRLYREWLRKSLLENFCSDFLTFLVAGTPQAFLSLKMRDNVPYMDLLGVAEPFRGQGIGRRLAEYATGRLSRSGHRCWRIVTQGHNVGALRLYEKLGFQVMQVNLFYHVWLDEITPDA